MGMGLIRLIAGLAAAGTALTNSTTETALYSTTLPANSWGPGSTSVKVYKFRGAVRATATNATDTLRVRVRIGPTTLTGTVVFDSTAVDVANDDLTVWDLTITVRTTGSAGEIVVTGVGTIMGAEGTATARSAFERITSFNTTVDQFVQVTGVWSVANAGNSCQAESVLLEEAA
jgi:hypothetical protein